MADANPWQFLPSISPFVLPEDRPSIDTFNARLPRHSPFRIATEDVIPEPFVGSVMTAPVLLLQLNPGHDDTNAVSHGDPAFRAALLHNLQHAPTEWPFYFFDPRFRDSHPGGRWWAIKTRKLAESISIERLAHRLAVVEWFPYKSRRYKHGCGVPSQQYGFSIVASAIERGAFVVIARSATRWESSVPRLREYRRKLTLSSVQNVALTPNNLKTDGRKTPEAWDLLLEALE